MVVVVGCIDVGLICDLWWWWVVLLVVSRIGVGPICDFVAVGLFCGVVWVCWLCCVGGGCAVLPFFYFYFFYQLLWFVVVAGGATVEVCRWLLLLC